MSMNLFTVGLIILVISSIALNSSTALQASSKGLKLYLTIDTNLRSQDVLIDTYQYGNEVYRHDGFINTGSNELTLNYPGGLIDIGNFRICITAESDGLYNCGSGYNSEAKKPESIFVSLYWNGPTSNGDSQSQSQAQDQDQSQSQSQSQGTTIINCPANSKCVIEQ